EVAEDLGNGFHEHIQALLVAGATRREDRGVERGDSEAALDRGGIDEAVEVVIRDAVRDHVDLVVGYGVEALELAREKTAHRDDGLGAEAPSRFGIANPPREAVVELVAIAAVL